MIAPCMVSASLSVRARAGRGWPAEGLGARAGFKDLHSFAFLGGSGRIGAAQDGTYAYVPAC